MSSLDLRVLVLERQRLQIQKDLDDLDGIVTGGGLQPADPTLSALAALVGTANTLPYFSGTDVMALTPLTPYSRTLLDDADAGTWRSTLGLGTLATANAPLSVAQGGTGGTDAGTARANLGLGTMSVQNANAVAVNGGTLTTTSVYGLYVPPGVTTFYNEVGFGAAPQAGYSLYAQYQSWFGSNLRVDGNVGLGAVPDGTNRLLIAGPVYCNSTIRAAGGLTSDATLTVSGHTSLSTLSVNRAAPIGHDLYVGWMAADRAAFGRGNTAPRWELDCGGRAHCASLGVYYGGDDAVTAGCDLRVYRAQIDVLGLGYGVPSGINLRASSGYWDFLSVGGGIDTRFSIRWYGDVYAGATNYAAYPGPFVAYSDERMKTNIEPIPHPLETMCALRGVLYEWIDPAEHANLTGLQMGVIAQEVEAVLPEWVGELSGFKTTQLSRFEALTIEAVKALTARVAALETKGHDSWL